MINQKSNLTIATNVYVQQTEHFMDDRRYLTNITGKKFLEELKQRGYTLNDVQKEILEFTCFYAKDKDYEQSYGRVKKNGVIISECRCEVTECHLYNDCMSRSNATRIKRNKGKHKTQKIKPGKKLKYTYLGISFDNTDDTLKNINEIIEEECNAPDSEFYGNPVDITEALLDKKHNDFKHIEETGDIINADLTSHILVNAGPGTGKTYTAIQRILFLLSNEYIDPEEIIMLCYTRAAKKVIQDRIDANIAKGILPVYARNINVCTFDSLATNYLIAKGIEFESLNYNDRIKKFNEAFEASDFEEYRYVIIDELQDLVNQRARMVLNLVKNLNSGWLLLGDKCQAIYDYDCDDETDNINSVEFYSELEKTLPHDVLRYEITVNKRQSKALEKLSDSVRNILLNQPAELHNKLIFEKISSVEKLEEKIEKFIPVIESNKTTAILCRSNGEAEKVSSILHSKRVEHTLLRGLGQLPQLNRWIADVLWDYCEAYIGHDEFIERYCLRVNNDTADAESKFDALHSLCEENDYNPTLLMSKIREKLRNRADLPDIFLKNNNNRLFVSTIHHAKGNEFDNVYLLTTDFNGATESPEEARVRYVAITRPREQLYLINKRKSDWMFKRVASGRCLRYSFHYDNTHCTNVVIGLNGDFVPQSFASGKIEDAINKQNYIAEQVKKDDPLVVESINSDNSFYVVKHNDTIIGYLSDEAISDLWNAVKMTSYHLNIPQRFSGLYVSDIITCIPTDHKVSVKGQFNSSQIWLGVEVTGFAKAEFK